MRRISLSVSILFLLSLFTISLMGCSYTSKKVSYDVTFEQTIDEKLNGITHPKDTKILLSSNPYDYFKSAESIENYNYIVSQGEKSLDYMLKKFAKSNNNGLEEYIMAIACADILKENPKLKNWASGREWYNNYIKK